MSPFSSIGFPKTSIILPRVSCPTGTDIGALVLTTSRPLFSPSVEPIAIVLTIPSPSCCCTSSTVSRPTILRASYTLGMFSLSNSTSITAPIICVTTPLLISFSFIQQLRRLQFLIILV